MESGVPSSREAITAALDQFDAAQANVAALSFQVLSAPEALTVKDRLEIVSRRLAHPKTQRRPHRMDAVPNKTSRHCQAATNIRAATPTRKSAPGIPRIRGHRLS
jgi:hypothetical protein